MNAHETHLGKILEGIKQYVVPLFQRPYTWDESRWKVLWADLVELCEDEQGTSQAKPHFLGSIVTVPTRSVPEGVTKFLLIDGQQRLTTLQVLLAALRDRSRELPGQLAERLDKSYLVNQFENDLDHFKLLPTQTNGDRAAFLAVMKGEATADSASRVAKAYVWFQKKLKARNSPDAERLAGVILRRLSLVSITLDHDDNPHLIFESLNYKGEPLTQGDLIRNYFLMRVPAAEQERLRETSPDTFDGIIEQFARLVGIDAGKFRSARSLGANLHFETNLSAEAIVRYCQQVVVAAGYSSGDWLVETN